MVIGRFFKKQFQIFFLNYSTTNYTFKMCFLYEHFYGNYAHWSVFYFGYVSAPGVLYPQSFGRFTEKHSKPFIYARFVSRFVCFSCRFLSWTFGNVHFGFQMEPDGIRIVFLGGSCVSKYFPECSSSGKRFRGQYGLLVTIFRKILYRVFHTSHGLVLYEICRVL